MVDGFADSKLQKQGGGESVFILLSNPTIGHPETASATRSLTLDTNHYSSPSVTHCHALIVTHSSSLTHCHSLTHARN